MTRLVLLAPVLLVGCVGIEPGVIRDDTPQLRPVPPYLSNPDSALAHLARAELFTTYHAGLAEDPTYQGAAFRTVYGSTDAPDRFARLLLDGSKEGQLYGLAGLWLADSTAYRAMLPSYLSQTDSLEVLYGCFRMRRARSEAVQDIEEGWISEGLAGLPLSD